MVRLLDIIKEEFKKELCTLRGREVSSRLEMSPKRKPLAKAHALFLQGFKEVGQDSHKLECSESNLLAARLLGKIFQSISIGIRMLTSRSSQKKSWDFVKHANAPLQFCPSKISNPGTFLTWNSKDSFVTTATGGGQMSLQKLVQGGCRTRVMGNSWGNVNG